MRRAEEKPLFWRRFPLPSPLLPPPAPHPVSERPLTAGDVRGELLDGDGLPRVEEVVHLAQGEVLAARRGGGGGLRRGRGGGGGVVAASLSLVGEEEGEELPLLVPLLLLPLLLLLLLLEEEEDVLFLRLGLQGSLDPSLNS